jgi:hypothetical protein
MGVLVQGNLRQLHNRSAPWQPLHKPSSSHLHHRHTQNPRAEKGGVPQLDVMDVFLLW